MTAAALAIVAVVHNCKCHCICHSIMLVVVAVSGRLNCELVFPLIYELCGFSQVVFDSASNPSISIQFALMSNFVSCEIERHTHIDCLCMYTHTHTSITGFIHLRALGGWGVKCRPRHKKIQRILFAVFCGPK